MITRRIRRRPVPDAALAALLAADCPPLLARIYAARGVHGPAGLERGLAGLPPPDGLLDLPAGAVIVWVLALVGLFTANRIRKSRLAAA